MLRRALFALSLGSLLICSAANARTLSAEQRALVEADRVRIQHHLELVEKLLRSRDVSHLSKAQKQARARNLDLLRRYWKAGVFPHNHVFKGRRPIFIDKDGRACAVGYLMLHNGGAAAARAVAKRENLAYVEQIKTRSAHQWIKTSGLSAAEAALIQPSYNFLDMSTPDAGKDAVPAKDTTPAKDSNAPKADTGQIPTSDDGGCAIAGAPAGQVIPLVLIGLLLAQRRRRRRRV